MTAPIASCCCARAARPPSRASSTSRAVRVLPRSTCRPALTATLGRHPTCRPERIAIFGMRRPLEVAP
eukprot:5085694-Prymnesium_polylepis.2